MNKFFGIFLVIVTVMLLNLLAPILTPFLVGILLAYLVNPLVNQLMRLHLPRIFAVVIVFLALFLVITLLILLVVPMIQTQIQNLIEAIPDMIAWVQNTALPLVKKYLGSEEAVDIAMLKKQLTENWSKAGGAADWIVRTILHSGFALLQGFLNLILTLVVTFYLLYDWKKFIKGLHDLLPRKIEPTVVKLATECNEVLAAFFRGELIVMTILGIFYSVGLSLIGLKIGLVIGVLVGLLSIVPYLGIIVGVLAACIAALVQFGTYSSVLSVLLLFAVGQTLDGMFVTPNLIGGRIGLHPVAVIFAVLAGAALFGFFGVLLALPVAAIIMVLARHFYSHYHNHSYS